MVPDLPQRFFPMGGLLGRAGGADDMIVIAGGVTLSMEKLAKATKKRLKVIGATGNNLQNVESRSLQITADEIRQQALDNIRLHPGDDSTTDLPIESELAKLRQFIVEITFDFDSDRIRPESYESLGLIADAVMARDWDGTYGPALAQRHAGTTARGRS